MRNRALLTTPQHFPVADEAIQRDSDAAQYRWTELLGCGDRTLRARRGQVTGPQLSPDDWKKTAVRPHPVCDLTSHSHRLPLADHERNTRQAPWLGVSFLVHAGAIAFYALFQFLGWTGAGRVPEAEIVPVEVAFGLADGRIAAPAANEGSSAADLEATKIKEALPQLPKTLAVDGQEKAPDTMPAPPTPTPAATPKREVDATPEPGTKTLKAEEIAKRMEREQRKPDKQERAGTHSVPGTGAKDPSRDLPVDPFASAPSAPSNLPAGDPNGSLTSGQRTYQTAAKAHMQRNWNLPDVVKYDASLRTKAEIRLNMFGKILQVKVVKGSGDKEFDRQVAEAIERAGPFPDFSSEGITSRVLLLEFRPRDVKEGR